MYLGTGLGFSPARSAQTSALIKSYNFASMDTLPEELGNIRSGGAWYQDNDGYFHHETQSNTLRFGTVYGSERGALVEITITAKNLYSRPAAGLVTDHLTAGAPNTAIVNDTLSPCQNLAGGSSVWEIDNSAGETALDIEWAGAISSGKASAMAYIKTLIGDTPTLSISGNGTHKTGHSVNGYSFYKCEDRNVSGAEYLRISVPAGATIRVACVNFQAYDVITSFIDTASTALTRNQDDLNATDVSWWSGIQQGTFFFDFTHMDDTAESANIFEIRDGDLDDRFTIGHTSGIFYTTIKSSGVTIAHETKAGLKNLNRVRLAISYQDDQFIQSCNGFVDFIATSGSAPDTASFVEPPYPLSFLSVNRSGAEPLNGIVHGFALYGEAFTQDKLKNMTNPNQSTALWVTLFGDSNIARWNVSWSGRPQLRLDETLKAAIPNSQVTNEGKGGSAANYDAAQLLASDWWSGDNDSGGGNIYLESLDRNVTLTRNELRNFDYAVINLGANDLRLISNGDITVSEYKASFQNVIDLIHADYGPQVKLIMQNLASSDHSEHTQADTQAMREAMAQLVDENISIIASYDTYDVARVDELHADEDGCNILVDRLANIILADLGLEEPRRAPQVMQARHNGNTITLDTDASALSGDDPSIFYVEVNNSPMTITSALTSGTKATLILDSVIEDGDDVRLWVGYGKMDSLTPAHCIIDTISGYPLRSAANIIVTGA
jgi:hypothetical protein